MTRATYSFAILLTGLAFLVYFIHSVIYFQLGRPMYTMESFLTWFTVITVINLLALVVILKYYSSKNFRFTLIAWIVATIGQLVFSLVVYGTFMGMDLNKYYIPTYLFSLVSGIASGVSLIIPPAGKLPWLKAAGIVTVVLGVILLTVVISFMTQSMDVVQVERVHQWTAIASSFIPALFMMNLINEHRQLRENRSLGWKPLEPVLTVASVAVVFVALFAAAIFTTEGIGAIAWHKKAPERAKRLAEPFEARTFVGRDGSTLLYRFMRPVDYDSTKTYPIVVCLHHGGTHGDDNMKQIDGSPIAQLLTTDENKRKYPAFLFVPQCPVGKNWGGVPSLPAIDSLVFEGLAAFEKEFSVDKTRRYVAGTSGGGYGSWHFICSRPEMFAAAIPVCGGTDPALAGRIVDVPVWAFHGANDRNVPVRHSRDMIAAIKAAGGNPRYTEFPDQAHNIWPQVNATPGLLEWMFEQKK